MEKYSSRNKNYGLTQELYNVPKTFNDLGKDEEIDITKTDISTPQDFLNMEDVARYMSNKKYEGIKAISYFANGKRHIMIVDGNHRFVAAKLNGVKKIKMREI